MEDRNADGEDKKTSEDVSYYQDIATSLLKSAGGGLSEEEAGLLLGISQGTVRERIRKSQMLGMSFNGVVVVPRFQFVVESERAAVIPGIERVIMTFKEAEGGPWMVLEFLVEDDLILGRPPIDALKDGLVGDVEHAARAALQLDER